MKGEGGAVYPSEGDRKRGYKGEVTRRGGVGVRSGAPEGIKDIHKFNSRAKYR